MEGENMKKPKKKFLKRTTFRKNCGTHEHIVVAENAKDADQIMAELPKATCSGLASG